MARQLALKPFTDPTVRERDGSLPSHRSTKVQAMTLFPRITATSLLLLAGWPLSAFAHTGVNAGLHGFATGFVHPLTGGDHLAAMVAVGLWSALAARRWQDLLAAPAAFTLMLLAGAVLGRLGVGVPAVEAVIGVSLLALGLLVITRWRMPMPIAVFLVGAFALFHGHAHGRELSAEANATMALGGMLAASLLLHCAGIALGAGFRNARPWPFRLAGLIVAALGGALLSTST